MYLVSGSNIFNQWFQSELVFNKFRAIDYSDDSFNLNTAKLIHINWSYNIFEFEDTFFITNSDIVKKLKLPKDIEGSQVSTNFIINGNDNNLILACTNTLWILNIETEELVKKNYLNIEAPLKRDSKKKRINNAIIKISIVNDSCLYLTENGNVYCGMLPSYVDTEHCLGKVIDIECGYEHFVILTDAGRVYTWGNGRRLQLGHGDVNNLDTPTEIEALAGIKITKIKAGGWHSLALSEFGDLYSWGWNDTGQLGIHDQKGLNSYSVPTLVDLFDSDEAVHLNVIDIACGSRHSAIMLEDKSVWTTGLNKYGQLGLSSDIHPFINNFKKVFQSAVQSSLMCGPWTTVIVNNENGT